MIMCTIVVRPPQTRIKCLGYESFTRNRVERENCTVELIPIISANHVCNAQLL